MGAELSEHTLEVLVPIAIWAGKDIGSLTADDINAYKAAQKSETTMPVETPKTVDNQPSEYINIGSTASPEWNKIATIKNPTVNSLSAYQQVDANFKAGECGVFSFNFRVFPSFAKDYITTQMDSQLRSRGVKLWRPSYFDGSTLNVCFITGIAPLVIAALAIAALIAIAAILAAISIYKLKRASVDAYNNQQQQLQDEYIKSVNEIEDPADRAKYFSDYSEQVSESAEDKGIFDLSGMFEKPMMVLVVMAGLVVALLLFLKFR